MLDEYESFCPQVSDGVSCEVSKMGCGGPTLLSFKNMFDFQSDYLRRIRVASSMTITSNTTMTRPAIPY
jgi:hypothetical protein